MRKRFPAVAGLFALVLGLALATPRQAAAQTSPITLRLGVGFPLGDTEDSAVLAVGGEFDFPRRGQAQLSLSLDWLEVTTQIGPFENDVTYVPLLLNARWARSGGIYYGGGIGVLFADDDPILDTEDTNLGWQIFLGKWFRPRIRGDLRFLASDSPGDDGVFMLQVGYRL